MLSFCSDLICAILSLICSLSRVVVVIYVISYFLAKKSKLARINLHNAMEMIRSYLYSSRIVVIFVVIS